MSARPQLIYFDVRGRAEPIRLLLAEVGADYDDFQIPRDQWPELKPRTPFQRLPIYREGTVEIPETFAILAYLGRKHGLLGDDEATHTRCDITIEAWRDYDNRVSKVFLDEPTSAEAQARFIESELPQRLADLEAFYAVNADNADNAPFWVGESLTIADIAAFHFLAGILVDHAAVLSRFPRLESFLTEFSARPRIHAYLNSDRRPAAQYFTRDGQKVYPRAPASDPPSA